MTATQVTAADDSSCALLSDGSVQCWGEGYSGELGNGSDEAVDAPVMALDEALKEAKIPPERFVALKPGQVYEI